VKPGVQKNILPLLAIVLAPALVRADVDSYAVFKVAVYGQTNSTRPVAVDSPDAYYFAAEVLTDTNGVMIDSASITAPDAATWQLSRNLHAPTNFDFISPYYADKAAFDSNFSNGGYLFSVNNGGYSEYVFAPEDLYSSVVPFFTGDTWSRFQSVDPAQPLKLCWNNFISNAGATSACIFVSILDIVHNCAYSSDALPADQTNLCVPANTLEPGTPYTIQILFSDRNDAAGFPLGDGAPALEGFDNLTFTSLNTLAPTLGIAPGTNAVVVSWPATASNYYLFFLESTPQLSPPSWSGLAATFTGNQVEAVVPTDGHAQYFRLVRLPLGP
jgi:hypothetical protein